MRTMPSQIVACIYRMFPNIDAPNFPPMERQHRPALAALLRLIDKIPAELLIVDPGELERFNIAVEAVRSQLDIWRDGQFPIRTVQGLDNIDILRVIVRVLRECQDEAA